MRVPTFGPHLKMGFAARLDRRRVVLHVATGQTGLKSGRAAPVFRAKPRPNGLSEAPNPVACRAWFQTGWSRLPLSGRNAKIRHGGYTRHRVVQAYDGSLAQLRRCP